MGERKHFKIRGRPGRGHHLRGERWRDERGTGEHWTGLHCSAVLQGYHLLSPESAGLFHRGICQSGVPLSTFCGMTKHPAAYCRKLVQVCRGLYTQNKTSRSIF